MKVPRDSTVECDDSSLGKEIGQGSKEITLKTAKMIFNSIKTFDLYEDWKLIYVRYKTKFVI